MSRKITYNQKWALVNDYLAYILEAQDEYKDDDKLQEAINTFIEQDVLADIVEKCFPTTFAASQAIRNTYVEHPKLPDSVKEEIRRWFDSYQSEEGRNGA